MMPLLTAAQMREMDRVAIEEVGIGALVLMETAGRAVGDAVDELVEALDAEGPVLCLAGRGNNGGDAVVAARHLDNLGHSVTLAVIGDLSRASADLTRQLEIADRLRIPRVGIPDEAAVADLEGLLSTHSVVVDGLFGTGLSRPVEGLPARVIDLVNQAQRPVVAIDLPSGVNADTGALLGTAIDADVTVTFALPKIGHAVFPGRARAGQVRVVDIGIPYDTLTSMAVDAHLVGEEVLDAAFPPRPLNTHKGKYGHLLVVAGTPECPGSALLAGRAALRMGTGLVTIASDGETVRRLAPQLEALMGLGVGTDAVDATSVVDALGDRDALAIGPSLPPDAHLFGVLRAALEASEAPAVLDAGALRALGTDWSWLAERPGGTVLTPHPGEMAALLGTDTATVQGDRLGAARSLAAGSGATVVLKGASTVVADPDGQVGVVTLGNPGMATAGMGDVLTGVIGGLLAQGIDPSLAARAGVFAHAAAADRAAEEGEQVARLTAPDVIDALLRGPVTEDDE